MPIIHSLSISCMVCSNWHSIYYADVIIIITANYIFHIAIAVCCKLFRIGEFSINLQFMVGISVCQFIPQFDSNSSKDGKHNEFNSFQNPLKKVTPHFITEIFVSRLGSLLTSAETIFLGISTKDRKIFRIAFLCFNQF